MTKHFQCTACGKCCYGLLPLTYRDALAHANLFPLCVLWTPVQRGTRDFEAAKELGIQFKFNHNEMASFVTLGSFVPKSFRCPALRDDNLCAIHSEKPARCRAMPFNPCRSEMNQSDLLNPREGWACDVSPNAPVVYENRKIIDRSDFDAEKALLQQQVPAMQRYANYMFKYFPSMQTQLGIAATKQKNGYVVTSLSSFLTATRDSNASQIALDQRPILKKFASMTEGKIEHETFHKFYLEWEREMDFMVSNTKRSMT